MGGHQQRLKRWISCCLLNSKAQRKQHSESVGKPPATITKYQTNAVRSSSIVYVYFCELSYALKLVIALTISILKFKVVFRSRIV